MNLIRSQFKLSLQTIFDTQLQTVNTDAIYIVFFAIIVYTCRRFITFQYYDTWMKNMLTQVRRYALCYWLHYLISGGCWFRSSIRSCVLTSMLHWKDKVDELFINNTSLTQWVNSGARDDKSWPPRGENLV